MNNSSAVKCITFSIEGSQYFEFFVSFESFLGVHPRILISIRIAIHNPELIGQMAFETQVTTDSHGLPCGICQSLCACYKATILITPLLMCDGTSHGVWWISSPRHCWDRGFSSVFPARNKCACGSLQRLRRQRQWGKRLAPSPQLHHCRYKVASKGQPLLSC